MKSIWSDNCNISKRQDLNENINTDVVVIGAGMAGILTAYMLKQRGFQVIILEANEIASGMTKNTTAKITAQHNLIYDKLITDFGEEKAKQYAIANTLAVDNYRELIEQENIKCHFRNKSAFVYTLDDMTKIQKEIEAAKQLGINARLAVNTPLPFEIKGAVEFENQAQFNPLEFIKAITKDLVIYENTMVQTIEDNVVITNKGKVLAKSIVMATHYPFINAPGYYFMRMHQQRSYVVAFENAAQLDGMYIDADENGFSFRNYEDLLLIGGAGHRTGENQTGGCYETLRKHGLKWYPNANERYFWSAQDCMTLDGVPYIGQYSNTTPNLYVATGFNKWGMTSSMVSAMIISDMISEKQNVFSEIFSSQRFNVSASAKNLIKDGTKAVSGLMTQAFLIPKEKLVELPNSHGGIVEYNGQKVGVYKDEEGKTFMVSTKCPHLGCQLEWNPDELSWDCPCHGSRFDYKGNIIDNPSIHGLETK